MMAKTKNRYPTSFNTYKEFLEIFDSIPEENRLEWAESLDPKLLQIKTDYGWTVAHVLAWRGTLPEKFVTDELLRMEDKDGRTVAHVLAERGTLPERFVTEELLRVKDNNGRTVAHELAGSGTLPERFITEELLRVKDNNGRNGRTVAHSLAWSGTLPERFITEELLRIKDKNGWTVAHDLAKSGTLPKKFFTEELLRMKTDWGLTVARSYYEFLPGNSRWDLLAPAVLDAPYEDETPMIDQVTEDLSGMNDVKLERVFFLLSGETRMKLLSDIKNPDLLERIRKCLNKELENEAFETSPNGEQDLHSEGQESLYCGMRSDR